MKHVIIDGIESKECTKCHKIFPLSQYSKDCYKKDGLSCSCKECNAKKDKAIYLKDPKKKYNQVKEYMKKTGAYYKYKPYNPDYYKSDISKEKKRIRDKKRKRLEKEAAKTIPITKNVRMQLLQRSNGKCEYCGKDCIDNYHIDHKIPLSRGGSNNISNLAFCCPNCNWSKGTKTAEEFLNKT